MTASGRKSAEPLEVEMVKVAVVVETAAVAMVVAMDILGCSIQ